MAVTILNEQYPPRKPKLTLTADSLDELPTEGVAEGSTATVGGTEYSYDSNAGWIEPGSGGGGSDVFWVNFAEDAGNWTSDKTAEEVYTAAQSGMLVRGRHVWGASGYLFLECIQIMPAVEGWKASFAAQGYSDDPASGDAWSEQLIINQDGTVTYTAWTWEVENDN